VQAADGFLDLQVNGYVGVDFNRDEPLLEPEIEKLCASLTAGHVQGILATIITDSLPVMERRLQQLVHWHRASSEFRQIVRGIHIEGPFLNPADGYRGAHPADAVMKANPEAMARLLEAAGDLTRLVTLAPEQDPDGSVTRMLRDRGIVVSAGHTNASEEQLRLAIDSGLQMFTHLGNGCPQTLPRHDNIVQRVLSLRGQIWLCFIADGAHIPFFALKNYLDLAGLEKSIVVTDAISAAGLGPGRYSLGRWTLDILDGVARSPDGSHLVGSVVTMQQSFDNLVEKVGLTPAQAHALLVTNPRRALEMN
jgi:N-acetylglucosamine-6-phosphate deacetylase